MQDETLFNLALEKPADERGVFLEQACGGNLELLGRVEALLGAHLHPGSFLKRPALDPGVTSDCPPGAVDESGYQAVRPPVSAVGSRIGPYKLLQILGEGGMGTVWVAEQQEPVKRRVALKVIKAGMDTAQVLRRFEAERQALAMMDHTNIAKVLEAGTTNEGRPYFVMELVKGVPITKYCDELHLPISERLALFVPVCQAIQHAHQKGIIHRDIKPSNILVAIQDGKPVPKVIDFGVAKALHQSLTEQSLYTEIGQIIGTLEYMSPEQAELSALDIDTRADVYALGVLLYELLTGTTPLDRKRLRTAAYAEMLRIIRDEDPPKPSTRLTDSKETLASLAAQRRIEPSRLAKELRGELDWIAMKCLEKDRTRRYETANGLARDVERYLADEPVEACPPRTGYRLRKFVRKNRVLFLTATAFAILLGSGALLGTWLAVKATIAEAGALKEKTKALAERDAKNDALGVAEVRRTEAEDARRETDRALTDMYTASGLVAGERNEPAQAMLWFANAASLARSDPEREDANRARARIWGRQVAIPVLAIAPTGSRIKEISFHPQLAYVMVLTEGSLCMLRGFAPEQPVPLPGGERTISAASWSPDGEWLALGTPQGEVTIFGFPSGEVIHRHHQPGTISVLSFNKDGRYLAIAGDSVRVWDCREQQFATAEFPHPRSIRHLTFNSRGDRLLTGCTDSFARVFAVPGKLDNAEPLFPPVPNSSLAKPIFIDNDLGLLTAAPRAQDDVVHEVAWYDASTGQRLRLVPSALINQLAMFVPSPDGRHFAIAGFPSVELWQVNPIRLVGQPMVHGHRVGGIAFSPDSQSLLTVSANRKAQLWSIADAKPEGPALVHEGTVERCAYSTDGRFVATGQEDGLVRVWRLPQGGLPRQRFALDSFGTGIKLSADGRYVLCTGANKYYSSSMQSTRVYDVKTGEAAGPALAVGELLMDAALSPDSKQVATVSSPHPISTQKLELAKKSASESGHLQLWDRQSGKSLFEPFAMPSPPRYVSYSPDGERVAVICLAGEIVIIDPRQGNLISKAQHQAPKPAYSFQDTPGLRFTPDGKSFFTHGPDNTVQVWETATAHLRYAPLPHNFHIKDALPSLDGRWLVTASLDRNARVWDLESGKLAASPLLHPDWVFAACFSPDGRHVLTGCRDGMARLWDWRTGGLVCPPFRHSDEVFDVSFTPDGRFVLTGCVDGTARLWEWRTGKAVSPPIIGGGGRIWNAQITADGSHALIAGEMKGILAIRLDELTSDQLKPMQLSTWTEAVSGYRIHEGDLATLTTDEWLQRWQSATPGPMFQVLSQRADLVTWHRRKAEDYQKDRQWQAARWHLDRLIELDPKDYSLRSCRGQVLASLREAEKALGDLTEAIRQGQADREAYYFRAFLLFDKQQFDRAFEDISEALRLGLKSPLAHDLRGSIHLMRKQYEKANDDFSEAIRLAPMWAVPRGNQGYAYAGKGEYDKALINFVEAIGLDPKFSEAYRGRGYALTCKGQFQEGLVDFEKALELNANNYKAFYFEANVFLQLGKVDEYGHLCARMLDQFEKTEDPVLANDVAWTCVIFPHASIESTRLVRLIEKAVAAKPTEPDFSNTLGAALFRAGRYEETVTTLDESVRTRDGKKLWADSLFLAMAHHHLGHEEQSRRLLAEATGEFDLAAVDMPKDVTGKPLDWTHLLQFQLLSREADELLTAKDASDTKPEIPEKL